jgi:hypothetical protein
MRSKQLAMLCVLCKEKTGGRMRRKFEGTRVGKSYLVCDRCKRAQRLRLHFKNPIGRDLYGKFLNATKKQGCRVLVWGAAPGTAAASKRHQIRDELQANGHSAFFSEDLSFPASAGVPTNIQELLQLNEYDLVVNVANSYGSLGEAHEYAIVLKQRLLLWLPDAARGGFLETGLAKQLRLLGFPPIFFTNEDLASCVVAIASADWVDDMLGVSWSCKTIGAAFLDADPLRR